MRGILEYDFVRFARQPRFFVLRTVVVGVPVLVLAAALALTRIGERPDAVGRMMLSMTATVTLALVVLLTPGLVAPVLPDERRGNKIDVIRSTPMTIGRLVMARFASRVALVGVVCLAALPLAAIGLPFGGVMAHQLVAVAGIVLATVPWVAAVGMLAGATTLDSAEASRRAYAFVIAPLIATAALAAVASATSIPWLATFARVAHDALGLNPIEALREIMGRRGAAATSHTVFDYAIKAAALSAVALWLAVRLLRSEGRTRISSDARPVGTSTAPRRGFYWRRRGLVHAHPLVWLESIQAKGGSVLRGLTRGVWALVAVAEFFFVRDFLAGPAGLDGGGGLRFDVILPPCICLGVAFILVGVNGATAFHRDGDGTTRDLLFATPVTNREIIVGKFAGVVRPALAWWLLGCAHVVFLCCVTDLAWSAAVQWVLTTPALVAACAAFALRISLKAVSGSSATVKVLTRVWLLAFFLPTTLAGEMIRTLSFQNGAGVIIGGLPFFLAASAIANGARFGMILRIDLVASWVYAGLYAWFAWRTVVHVLPRNYTSRRADPSVPQLPPDSSRLPRR